MRQFIQRHRDQIQGVLSGFDRLRLRGTLRLLTSVGGMMSHLSRAGVLIKDFMGYAEKGFSAKHSGPIPNPRRTGV